MTRILRPYALVAVPLVVMLGGCASQSPMVDRHFGEAVVAARAMQTVDPDASRAPAAPAGLDGRAARAALERYHESFKTPAETSKVFNIGVGTSE